ncbi:MAG TPA: hypothetical protein VGD11_06120, partial [Mycobacteriales bacterium]
MQHRARWTSAAAACVVALAMLPGITPPAATAAEVPAEVPVTHPPRLAFTADHDEPAQWEVIRAPRGGLDRFTGVPVVPAGGRRPGPVHDGETSYTQATRNDGITVSAFVSTADSAAGDVYVAGLPGTSQPLRVTCDDAVETHPVVSPDGTSVAYASDVSGDFRIWVVRPVDVTAPCGAMPRFRLTDGPGQDLWPSWAPSGEVVFSSTRADPLGDLYVQGPPGDGGPSPAVRLTDDPAADTQPFVGSGPSGGNPVVAFTTTRFRPDGSLAFLPLPVATDGVPPVPAARSAWAADPPQSSEPALAPGGSAVAYTGTAADPHGDVWVGSLTGGRATGLPTVGRADPVAAQPGVAESHGTWAQDFRADGGATDTTVAQLVVTRRSFDAGVDDVVAADGSARRTIAAGTPVGVAVPGTPTPTPGSPTPGSPTPGSPTPGTPTPGTPTPTPGTPTPGTPTPVPATGSRDPATPAYSPDGTRIAYSRELVAPPGTVDFGRELVVA